MHKPDRGRIAIGRGSSVSATAYKNVLYVTRRNTYPITTCHDGITASNSTLLMLSIASESASASTTMRESL